MNDFFVRLTSISRRRRGDGGSPFTSLKAAEKWLSALPGGSGYDTHHALIQGLEHFNAEHVRPSRERMAILRRIEAAGLPLQADVVGQYVRNQVTFRFARQALWRESWAFWSLLAEAWMRLLKHAHRDPACADLKPDRADIAARALRYTGRMMRWDYHQARGPAGSTWLRVHRIYRLAERDGYASEKVSIEGRSTHCAREYAQVVAMGMVRPLGYRVPEIESMARLIEACEALPLAALTPQHGMHTHVVDLSLSEGARVLDATCIQGARLRYFAMGQMVEHLKSRVGAAENDLGSQMASLVERGAARRTGQRMGRAGPVWVASGIEGVLAALGSDAAPSPSAFDEWILRDESGEGMGFILPESRQLPSGRLLATSWDRGAGAWQLLVIRWVRDDDGRQFVGAQSLSRHPKRVEVLAEDAHPGGTGKTWAIFLPMVDVAEQGVSNLLLPQSHYRQGASLLLRDGDVVYRLRLGAVQETHEGWVRVAMDILGRSQFAAAA